MPRQTDGVSYTPQWNFLGTGDSTTLQTFNSLNDTYSLMLTEPLGDLRYQPLNAKLTAIGALANGAGVLTNNGSGVFSYAAVTGGTVTNVSSANADIGVATGTTTPVLTLNSGTGANQIPKRDGSGNLNAELWGSQLYQNGLAVTQQYGLAFDSSTSTWRAQDAGGWKAWVGLNDGSTLTNSVSGSSATVTSIGNLTGDITSTNRATTLATVNGNVGTFGTATDVSTVTVNAKGLVTAASTTPIQIAESQVTNLVSDLAGKQASLGFTPENVANKATDLTSPDNTKYPTTQAVATAIAGLGSGSVTDVSVVSANGISGSVATSTTTPAITLTLGAITPTSTNGVSATTMAFNDATSSIQTQLDAKLSTATAASTYLPKTAGSSEKLTNALFIERSTSSSAYLLDINNAHATQNATAVTLHNNTTALNVGVERSGGGAIITGAPGNSGAITTTGAQPLYFGINEQVAGYFDGTTKELNLVADINTTGANVSSLTASQLVATDGSKNLVSVTDLPSGTTATTQSAGDNSTKVQTTAGTLLEIAAFRNGTNTAGNSWGGTNNWAGTFNGFGYDSDPTSGNKLAVNGNFYVNGNITTTGSITSDSGFSYKNGANTLNVTSFPTANRSIAFPDAGGVVSVVTSGSGAPGTTPTAIGMLYVDTTNFKLYFSKAVASSADWIIVN